METILPVGKIISMEKLADGKMRIKQIFSDEVISKKATSILEIIIPEIMMRCVEAESISLDDKFLKDIPKIERKKETKALIREVIENGSKCC